MRVAALLSLPLLGACHNACQDICVRMAKYAEECGYSVSEAELAACIDEQAGEASKEARGACRDYGSLQTIRTQLTCDDVGVYWEGTTTAQ
jgi:hypothetical protein